MERYLLTGPIVTGQVSKQEMVLKTDSCNLDVKKKRFNEGGETLEQVDQLSSGCPVMLTLPVSICIS